MLSASTIATLKDRRFSYTSNISVLLFGIPMMSTAVLGIHYCDPLKYSTIAFASLTVIGAFMAGVSIGKGLANARRGNADSMAATGCGGGCGIFLAVIGSLGFASCMFAGLGVIPQHALQDTLSGRIFIQCGIAPSALETGPVVGIDFAFAGVAMLISIITFLAVKASIESESATRVVRMA